MALNLDLDVRDLHHLKRAVRTYGLELVIILLIAVAQIATLTPDVEPGDPDRPQMPPPRLQRHEGPWNASPRRYIQDGSLIPRVVVDGGDEIEVLPVEQDTEL